MVKHVQAAAAASASAPAGVENLADLAREATDLDVSEHQERQNREDQQQRQEERAAQAEANETAKALAVVLRKVRDVSAGVMAHSDTLPAEQFMPIWNDKAVGEIAEALVNLPDEATGWLMELVERIAPYGALAFAVGAPSWATYLAVKAHRKEKGVVDVEAKPADGQQQPS